jgi:hypothetical protein
MKSLVTFLFSACLYLCCGATIQGTIKPGSTSNRVRIILKSNVNFSATPLDFIFALRIPTTGTVVSVSIKNQTMGNLQLATLNDHWGNTTNPTISLVQTGGFTYFLFAYNVITINSPSTDIAFVANVEKEVAEVEFSGAPMSTNVQLVNTINGDPISGVIGQYNFFTEFVGAGDQTNATNMFYGPGSANSAAGYSGFSQVPLNIILLPTKLESFDLLQNNCGPVQLTWKADEDINDLLGYEIEGSSDSRVFKYLSSIQPLFVTPANYKINLTPHPDLLFYRLRIRNKNGDFFYSQIRKGDAKCSLQSNNISLFPNPVPIGERITIDFKDSPSGKYTYEVINTSGQNIFKSDLFDVRSNDTKQIILDVKTPGYYYIRLMDENKKMIKTGKVLLIRR